MIHPFLLNRWMKSMGLHEVDERLESITGEDPLRADLHDLATDVFRSFRSPQFDALRHWTFRSELIWSCVSSSMARDAS